MYYPIGWPRQVDLIGLGGQTIRKLCCDRVKILFAVLTDESLAVYYTNVCSISLHLQNEFMKYYVVLSVFAAMCADCDIETNNRINFKTWHELCCRMETRFKYAGGGRESNHCKITFSDL